MRCETHAMLPVALSWTTCSWYNVPDRVVQLYIVLGTADLSCCHVCRIAVSCCMSALAHDVIVTLPAAFRKPVLVV